MNNKLLKGLIVFIGYLVVPMIVNSIIPSISESNTLMLVVRIIIYLVLIALCIFIYKDDLKKEWSHVRKNKKKFILTFIIFFILATLAMAIGSALAAGISGAKTNSNNNLIESFYKTIPLYMIFETLIYAPIIEEFVFRKVFYDIIPSKVFYVIFSALVFGFYHLGYNMASTKELLTAIPYVLMGMVLSVSYIKTKSIYAPIAIHFFYNLMCLIMMVTNF